MNVDVLIRVYTAGFAGWHQGKLTGCCTSGVVNQCGQFESTFVWINILVLPQSPVSSAESPNPDSGNTHTQQACINSDTVSTANEHLAVVL